VCSSALSLLFYVSQEVNGKRKKYKKKEKNRKEKNLITKKKLIKLVNSPTAAPKT